MTLNIAYTVNREYIKYLYVSLMSLLRTNEGNEIVIHILSEDLKKEDITEIAGFISSYNQKCEFYSINDLSVFHEYLHSGYSIEVFLRLYLPWTLDNVDKVLYIDADTLVQGNLVKYFEIDLNNLALAGCQDSDKMKESVKVRNDIFERKNDYSYFNAGVMLWNLEYIRKTITMDDFFKAIHTFGDKLSFNDQDILNYIFYGKIFEIDNVGFNYIVENHKEDFSFSDDVKKSDIIHFAGLNPWKYGKINRIDFKLWWESAYDTPYYGMIVEDTLKNVSDTIDRITHEDKIYKSYTEYKLSRKRLSELSLFLGCSSIIIYGAGAWGNILIEELKDIDNKIKYVFGKNVGESIGGHIVKSFNDYSFDISENDLIVITPFRAYEEIYNSIKDVVNAKIVNLVDVWEIK